MRSRNVTNVSPRLKMFTTAAQKVSAFSALSFAENFGALSVLRYAANADAGTLVVPEHDVLRVDPLGGAHIALEHLGDAARDRHDVKVYFRVGGVVVWSSHGEDQQR